jgi:two-component system NtrC family sensor kinase
MKITRLLAFRLFVIVLSVMLVSTAIFTTITVNWNKQKYLSMTTDWALKASDIVKKSTKYSMLHNRREDIYEIINNLGSGHGFQAIRIYNKKGEITFSTDTAEVGRYVNMSAEACNACHRPGRPPIQKDTAALTRIFNSSKGYRVLGVITPIKNEPSCSNANCHVHPENQTVLGVLDVMIPLSDLDKSVTELKMFQYLDSILMVIAVTAFSGIFIWIMVNKPVRKLIYGTHEITKGNLDYRIDVKSTDEIGELASSFNTMASELKRANAELLEWAKTLEDKVAKKTEELRRALSNMVQMEKMASLGKLAATVAHELNNPLEGILTYAKLLKKRFDRIPLSSNELLEIQNELSIIAHETCRCGNIVKNLLLFSRQRVGEFKQTDLRSVIEQTLKLISHHLEMSKVKPEVTVPSEPVELICDPQQIEQALLALEINAIEAMPDGGKLRVEVIDECEKGKVIIKVSDTGIGIPEYDIEHIFEPFFTTKKDGKGTGLGLAVTHGIIERHGGTIEVNSQLNLGTTFTITLPKTSEGKATTDSTKTNKETSL